VEILNIGIPEILLILTLTLILLGPEGMASSARTLAKTWRKFIHSPLWKDIVSTQREIKEIPTRLVREAGYDEINSTVQQMRRDASEAVKAGAVPVAKDERSILPPAKPSVEAKSEETAPVEAETDAEFKPEQTSKWDNLTGDHRL